MTIFLGESIVRLMEIRKFVFFLSIGLLFFGTLSCGDEEGGGFPFKGQFAAGHPVRYDFA